MHKIVAGWHRQGTGTGTEIASVRLTQPGVGTAVTAVTACLSASSCVVAEKGLTCKMDSAGTETAPGPTRQTKWGKT
jgi:hypothetical protein